jgi:arylsulfatase A-like enzyme
LPPTNLCPHYATLPTNQIYISTHQRQYYEAMVEALDTEIGRLLSVVNRTNTHIIFIGDNGTPGNIIQPPFPGGRGKDTLYEGGTRVPLIISGPAVVNPNRTNDTLSGMVDLFPTILEMAGSSVSAAVPSGIPIDGLSLVSVLQTTNTLVRYAYSELFGANVQPQSATGQTLRNSQFKLIRFSDKHEEFYDLQNDPYEAVNLLTNPLTATAQSNYFGLSLKLAGYQSALAQPVIVGVAKTNLQFTATVARATNLTYTLWRAPVFDDLAWSPQSNTVVITNGVTSVSLTDTNPAGQQNFYRVVGTVP